MTDETSESTEPIEPEVPTAPPVFEPVSNLIDFEVTNGASAFGGEGVTYPVVDERVSLPKGKTWYDPLIAAGVLKVATPAKG